MDDVPSNSLRIETMGEFHAMKSAGNKFYASDILYGRLRPYLNKIVVADLEGVASGEFIVMRARAGVEPRYLQLFMHSRHFVNLATSDTSGDRPRIDFDKIADLEIPIAPTAEQRRIVARIDELFTEVADGEAVLTRARDDLDTWRRALLKAAVTGELTSKWRKLHHYRESSAEYVQRLSRALNISRSPKTAVAQADHFDPVPLPESWTLAEIEDIFRVATGATPKRGNPRYYSGGTFPWVTSTVVNEPIVLTADQFITKAAIEETNAKVFPQGTILVAMYGEGKTRGKATELGIAAATNQACAALLQPDNDPALKSYVKYWFEYNYLELRKRAAGGVQPNLNLEIIKHLRIPIPPPDEMATIVSQLSDEFGDAVATSHELGEARNAAGGLRQSLLKAAFQGRLIEQESHDEPAYRLLVRLSELDDTAIRPRGARRQRGATLAAE